MIGRSRPRADLHNCQQQPFIAMLHMNLIKLFWQESSVVFVCTPYTIGLYSIFIYLNNKFDKFMKNKRQIRFLLDK